MSEAANTEAPATQASNDNPETSPEAISFTDLCAAVGVDEDTMLRRLAVILNKRDSHDRGARRLPARVAAVTDPPPLMVLPEHVLRRAAVRWRGHAARPGSGPEGETCGGCEHRTSVKGGAKSYSKCALAKAKWTGGPGSDIRKKDPACRLWTRRTR